MTPSNSASKRCLNKAFPYLVLFLLTNLIFVGLYRHFLLGHAAYMYADIGNDSLSSSYPILVMLSRLFHDGNLTAYDLTAGLGTDISATYLQYINPIKLMMLVFPTAKLPAAIICSTWVQVNLLALFGCLYFRQMLKNVWAAVVAALCWTYTGYVVLWGQNYSFLTTILLFTMTLYLLEMVLDGASLKITLWFIPVTALFLLSNYYFLYMTVVFAVFYVLLRCLFIKVKPLDYFKRIGTLAVLAVGGALMGAISVPSILSAFFSSNRTGAVSEAGAALSRISWYSPAEYLTMLGRLFSINLFGPGSGYTGALNYYEMVELAVSSLFLFALIYLLAKKGSGKLARLKVLFLTLISVLGLAMPLVSKLFTMVEGNQRFGFILCLLECLAIGAFVKGLITENSPAPLLTALLGTPVVVALCFAGIFLGRQKGFYQLSPKMLLMTAAFFVLYEIIFFIYYLMLRRRQAVATEAKASANISRGNAFILTMLLGLAFCELFLTNNVTVNDRIYLPSDAFETSYYNDGSQISLEAIKAADGDLYRLSHPRETDPALYGISATADFMFANEGSVNNYNGTTSYTSTLPASLSTYGSLYLSDLGKTNFFILNYDNYYLYTLMGGRYIISENDNENVMSTDTDLYDSTAVTSANGLETIFKNDNALPFGYLYENELKDYDNFKAANALQRGRLVTQNYFYTDEMMSADENASSSNAAFSLAGSEEFKISDQIVSTNDCNTRMDGDNLVVEATGADPFILCQIPQVPEGQACFLDLSISPDTAVAQNLQVFFATDTIGLSADFFKNIRFTDEVTEFLTLLPENCQLVRIDTTPGTVVAFDVANLTVCDPASDLADLKHSAVSNISFSNHNSKHTGIYQATVDVKNDTAMLAVPLPYSNKWQATIDGNPATVENINGGILGVPVEKGTHEITLVYATPLIKVGMLISLATCLLYIALYILVCRRR